MQLSNEISALHSKRRACPGGQPGFAKQYNYYLFMPHAGAKRTRTFSLDPEVLSEVERTKGEESASERVNYLLKWTLELERKMARAREAAEFFATVPDEGQVRRACQEASLKTWSRE